MTEAIRRVEAAAQTAFDHAPLSTDVAEPPEFEEGVDLLPNAPGFVQNVALEDLRDLCERLEIQIVVKAPPGHFADASAPLARHSTTLDADALETVRDCFNLGSDRDFHSDPCFGLIVLSEIASKALSPGVSDPGTAIHVIRAIERVLHKWSVTLAERRESQEETNDADQRVFLPGIKVTHALECGFDPIAFDGADRPEILRTLLSALKGLKAQDKALFEVCANAMGQSVVARGEASLACDADREALAQAAARMGFTD